MSTLDALTGATAAGAVAPAAKTKTDDAARAAEGFERMLVGQLSKQLFENATPQGDDAQSADTGVYQQMLPDAMTEALMSAGGIGLASQLADSIRGKAS